MKGSDSVLYINADGVREGEPGIRGIAWRKAVRAALRVLEGEGLDYCVFGCAERWESAVKGLPFTLDGNCMYRKQFVVCEYSQESRVLDVVLTTARDAFTRHVTAHSDNRISPELAAALWGDHGWHDNSRKIARLSRRGQHKLVEIVRLVAGEHGKTAAELVAAATDVNEAVATIIALLWCSPSIPVQQLYQWVARWLKATFQYSGADTRISSVLLAAELLARDRAANAELVRELALSRSVGQVVVERRKNGNSKPYIAEVESLSRVAARLQGGWGRMAALDAASIAIAGLATRKEQLARADDGPDAFEALRHIVAEVADVIGVADINVSLPDCVA